MSVANVGICVLTFYVFIRLFSLSRFKKPYMALSCFHVYWSHGACCPNPPPHVTVSSPYLCLCLMGSPCFGSIADVVQSHGGVFMDSSYPSSPITGPLSRGQRRASEVSIASQVSGMADSYTATNIANSKCSHYQPVCFSLPYTHTNTGTSSFPSFRPTYFYFSV